MLGRSRNIRKKAENSVAAPVPTAPAKSSCSTAASGAAARIRDTNSQERGDGKAVTSRSNTLKTSGRNRRNAITSGRMAAWIAHSDHSCASTSNSR